MHIAAKQKIVELDQSEILENGKLIAKFMNFQLISSELKKYRIFGKIIPQARHSQYDDYDIEVEYTNECYDYEFKFHTSWDWLMPVVQKCYAKSPIGISVTCDLIISILLSCLL